jgi:hypothetical protein
MLPFTRDAFFDVFAAYNAAIWPVAVAAYPLALVAMLFAWRSTENASRAVAAVLALMWGWVGTVYHGLYFSQINPIAWIFAAAFLAQAALFGIAAVGSFRFSPRSRVHAAAGGLLIAYAMIAYPLIGVLAGESYPRLPLFGVTPCPLLIFTFGMMLWADHVWWWFWIVPLIWTVIGGSAAVLLLVPQDWALPLSAVLTMAILGSTRQSKRTAPF